MNKYHKNKPTPTPSAVVSAVVTKTAGAGSPGARQSRTQRMARRALDCVKPVAEGGLAKDYKSRAMSFPTVVLQSGLAQAVGFLAAKSGEKNDKERAYQRYLEDVAKVAGLGSGQDLLKGALEADLPRYRLLTREVLDASAWIKRFCQSLIMSEDDPGENRHGP